MINLTPEQAARFDAIKQNIQNKNSLISQKTDSLAALQAKFDRLKNTEPWAEIDLNSTINAGTEVRYFFHTYICKTTHTKSLFKMPTNDTYWTKIEDET